MNDLLKNYEKKHELLICVDSDGCALDNLSTKHRLCFGPCLVREWDLLPWEAQVLGIWERINLYGLTRGIHRFRALEMALQEIDEKIRPIPDLQVLSRWVESTEVLSEAALEEAAGQEGTGMLLQALHWSREVNRAVAALPGELTAFFEGAMKSLQAASLHADIAVVSSANPEAVHREWKKGGMQDHVSLFLCQDTGSKSANIARLKEKGYRENQILMVGDAPGDRASAEVNGVFFYPILPRREEECWGLFSDAFERLKRGTYQELVAHLSEEFMRNLAEGQNHD